MNIIRILLALTLGICSAAALSGCPRRSNETAQLPADSKPPVANGQLAAPQQLKLPLAYLALGTGMQPAALPDDVLQGYPEVSRASGDKSLLHAGFADGTQYWYQSFSSAAKPEELLAYYDGILPRQGFEANRDINEETRKSRGYFSAVYTTRDGSLGLHIYSSDYDAAQSGKSVPYILFLQDLSQRATE